MNGRRTGGSRLWPSGSNEIRWCKAGCPSLPACLERNPPACRQWPDAQPDAVWADSASGTWHSPMAIFPASHQRIRWLSAGGWGRKNWRVFGGPPMYAIWVVSWGTTGGSGPLISPAGFNPPAPLPPPNFYLPTPAPFFALFFFQVPPPKIQIFNPPPPPPPPIWLPPPPILITLNSLFPF